MDLFVYFCENHEGFLGEIHNKHLIFKRDCVSYLERAFPNQDIFCRPNDEVIYTIYENVCHLIFL